MRVQAICSSMQKSSFWLLLSRVSFICRIEPESSWIPSPCRARCNPIFRLLMGLPCSRTWRKFLSGRSDDPDPGSVSVRVYDSYGHRRSSLYHGSGRLQSGAYDKAGDSFLCGGLCCIRGLDHDGLSDLVTGSENRRTGSPCGSWFA